MEKERDEAKQEAKVARLVTNAAGDARVMKFFKRKKINNLFFLFISYFIGIKNIYKRCIEDGGIKKCMDI